jgi:hypothetical protein
MPDNGHRTPEKSPIPDASGPRDGDPFAVPDRGRSGWLDFITPSHARFLMFPIFPRPEDDWGDRVLKSVAILAVLAVTAGLCFTMSRHLTEGNAIVMLRGHEYRFESRADGRPGDAADAAKAFRNSIEKIRGR